MRLPELPVLDLSLEISRPKGDREFLELLLDTLKVERCAYRELHEYMTAPGRRDS